MSEENQLYDPFTGLLQDEEMLEDIKKSLKILALPSWDFYRNNFPSYKPKDPRNPNTFKISIQPFGKKSWYFRDCFDSWGVMHKIERNSIGSLIYLGDTRDEMQGGFHSFHDINDAHKCIGGLSKFSRRIELLWNEYAERKAGQLFFEFYPERKNSIEELASKIKEITWNSEQGVFVDENRNTLTPTPIGQPMIFGPLDTTIATILRHGKNIGANAFCRDSQGWSYQYYRLLKNKGVD